MRRLVLLALVVPLAAGCGWFGGGWSAYPAAPKTGVLGPLVTPPPAHVPNVAHWIEAEQLPPRAVPGAKLFVQAGCTVCHTYAGAGASNLHAPDLTAIGRRRLGIRFEVAHLRCPSCSTPGSPMPSFAALGPKRLRELAIFLEASKGTR
ncbi:MAG TPA: c-type cytochrome [Gaiellaceae bacterium]|nr:c-type cytochrome [Gaiellaceae bacterium]